MKVIKTENRFKTGFQQPKSSFPENPVLTSLDIAQNWAYHPQNFYLIYTNLSVSEKSPLWKVFSSHIPVHYRL